MVPIFRAGHFNLKEACQSSKLTEVDDVIIKAFDETNSRDTTQEIAETLNIDH